MNLAQRHKREDKRARSYRAIKEAEEREEREKEKEEKEEELRIANKRARFSSKVISITKRRNSRRNSRRSSRRISKGPNGKSPFIGDMIRCKNHKKLVKVENILYDGGSLKLSCGCVDKRWNIF